MNKNPRITNQDDEKQDRFSSLPDEVIHQILSSLGTRLAVQTSILSNRWRHVWTTLPFLTFDWYDQLFPYTHSTIIKFMDHVVSNRNHQTHVFSFKFFAVYPFPPSFVKMLIRYPIEHNVQELDIDLHFHRYPPFKLSTFSSSSIQILKLRVPLDLGGLSESDCLWDLPVLKTLHLICPPHMSNYKLPESCFICLPALTTLCLDGIELPEKLSSFSLPVLKTLHLICPPHMSNYELSESCLICLPALTTLCLDGVELPESLSSFSLPITSLSMKKCKLPETVWNFPTLLSLELDDVLFRGNMTDFFSALVRLRNLTLIFTNKYLQDCIISCSQLVSLKISTNMSTCSIRTRKLVVVAPKLCELCCVGIFPVTLNVHELENVNIKLWDTNEFKNSTMSQKKVHYRRFIPMFSKLGSAKILTLDSATIEALSTVPDLFKRVPSPFKSLKYVKLPQGYKESSISTTLRKYLLGGNPRAAIVTALPQNNVNHQAVPDSLTSQKVMVHEPSASPTKELVDSQDIGKTVCVDTVEKRVQVEHLVDNSVIDVDRVRQVGSPVTGTCND